MCAAKLSIPKQGSDCDLGIAQNAEQLQQWLDSLPVADIENSALMVLQLLGTANRCDLQLEFRLKLMRSLNPLVDHITSSLRDRYSTGESPYSSVRNVKRIEVVKKLLQEMGYGFKILITKLYAMEEQAIRADLASSIFHTMRINACRLIESFSLYEPVVSDIWGEMSLLYRFAVKRNIHKDPFVFKKIEISCEQIYMQVLLLAAVNPYRLMRGETQKIFPLMGQWAAHAKLEKPADDWVLSDGQAELVVNLNSGEPPYIVSGKINVDADADLRVVNVSAIKNYLNEYSNKTREEGRRSPAKELSLRLQQDMMHRLIGGWKSGVDREDERFLRDDPLELALGIKDCYELFHVKEADDGFSLDDIGLVPKENHWGTAPKGRTGPSDSIFKIDDPQHDIWEDKNIIIGANDLIEDGEADQLNIATYAAKQVDVSAGGIGLAFSATTKLHAKVGDLVCVRLAFEGAQWRLGDVRWQQFSAEDAGLMGVRLISDNPVTFTCQALEGLGSNGSEQMGMLLHAQELSDPMGRLLVPAAIYDVKSLLSIQMRQEETKVVLTEKLETTSSFALFRYRLR